MQMVIQYKQLSLFYIESFYSIFFSFLPEICLSFGLIFYFILFLVPFFRNYKNNFYLFFIILFSTFCSLFFSFKTYNYQNLLISFYYTWFIKVFIILFVILFVYVHYLQVNFAWKLNSKIELDLGSKYFETNLFILVILLAGFFLLSSNDLICIYINIEILNICFTLICYLIYERTTIEATLKYFFTNIFFSYFILLGICFIYFEFYTFNFSQIIQILTNFNYYLGDITYLYFQQYFFISDTNPNYFLLSSIDLLNTILIKKIRYLYFGLFFILLGLLGKIGLFPGFFWVLDVYGNISLLSNILLSIIPKIFYLILIFHIGYCFEIHMSNNFNLLLFLLLLFSGIFTIIYAVIFTLNQWRIKRFLAGSSLVNLSFLIFLIAYSFINFDLNLISIIFFFLIVYLFNLFFFFLIYILFIQPSNLKFNYYFEDLRDFVQIRNNHKILSFLLALLILSFVGLPPLIGFFSKLTVFYYLVSQNNFILIFFIIIANVISAFYYIRPIRFLFFSSSKVFGLFLIEYNLYLYLYFSFILFFLFSFFIFDFFLYLP